jgi:HlyD family secretion protein
VNAAPFVESVIEEGRTRLRDTYTVSSPIAGYLQRVALESGDRVALDQVLFRMEAQPVPALDARSLEQARDQLAAAQARLQSARANLDTARAETRFTESEFERYRELHARNLISAAEMERRQSLRDRARAIENATAHAVEVAGFEVDSARAMLAIGSGERPAGDQPVLDVRSPAAGVVLRRFRCCEGAVGAGEPILEIGDLADLEIQVDLLSMDAVRVSPDMRVLINGWGGDTTLSGRVRRIEPAGFTRTSALGVDEQRVPVIVDFVDVAEAATWLGVGFRIEAEFMLWEGEDILQIPTSALFRDSGVWSVFVVIDGRAVIRAVEPGRRAGLVTQVVAGLSEGEIVITHPGDRVTGGVRVEPQLR